MQLSNDEKIFFAITQPNQRFEDALLKKVFDSNSIIDSDGNLVIEILPSDTENLLCGKYFYTIKYAKFEDGSVTKVVTYVDNVEFWVI